MGLASARHFLVGACLGVAGSAPFVAPGAPAPAFPLAVRHYDIAFAADLQPEQREAVAQAAMAWVGALGPADRGGLRLRVIPGPCAPDVPRPRGRWGLICVEPASFAAIQDTMGHEPPDKADRYVACTTVFRVAPSGGPGWARITLGPVAPEERVRVAAHELGHAMGLEHAPTPRALMYWRLVEHGPDEPTWWDLAAWYRVPGR